MIINTIGQAVLSASVLVIAFALIIVIIEEVRLWRGQREVDKIRAQVARDAALNAARRRHPSAIMRDDIEAAMRREIRAAKIRQSDEWMP